MKCNTLQAISSGNRAAKCKPCGARCRACNNNKWYVERLLPWRQSRQKTVDLSVRRVQNAPCSQFSFNQLVVSLCFCLVWACISVSVALLHYSQKLHQIMIIWNFSPFLGNFCKSSYLPFIANIDYSAIYRRFWCLLLFAPFPSLAHIGLF